MLQSANRLGRPISVALLLGIAAWASLASRAASADPDLADAAASLLKRSCVDCHGDAHQEAGVNVERLLAEPDFAGSFRAWRKMSEMLESGKMPPADAPQLEPGERNQLIAAIGSQLRKAAARYAADPGPASLRRLTSAEYGYTIRDLTGFDLGVEDDFVSDAVGGEGFTNIASVQFLEDSTLQRYLAAARKVAEHAVVGAGPLRFSSDPGQTGCELSAIRRIQQIYREHGFRTAAGEGGEAFGLERYGRALLVAWQHRFRDELGRPDATLASLAAEEKLDPRFAEYIWSVLTAAPRRAPSSIIVERWRNLPSPQNLPRSAPPEPLMRAAGNRIGDELVELQSRFGQNPDAKEEARILAADAFDVRLTQLFEMNVNWPPGTDVAHVSISVTPVQDDAKLEPVVIWRRADIQFRIPDRVLADPQPLRHFLTAGGVERLKFGIHPQGASIGENDFVTTGTEPVTFELPVPPGARSAALTVTAELDIAGGDDGIVRCTLSQREDTDQGKSVSALLANPEHPSFAEWKAGVLEFARLLPQVSHREPAPSDRDPVPFPFDGSYNHPERNHFHARIKYHRDDRFLVEHVLDDDARRQLDQAWADLLGSFDYHQALLDFVCNKYQLNLDRHKIGQPAAIPEAAIPTEVRNYIRDLHEEYRAVRQAFAAAESGHVVDVVELAGRAWRRPLRQEDRRRLRGFYQRLREEERLAHRPAIRALLARVLTAPEFLFRVETATAEDASPQRLSDWEIANRLSYFLWSSLPDEPLRRAAAAGQLQNSQHIIRQTRRMLRDPKAKRLAAEFFAQWFGFYQFDRYRGVDEQRFPDFTDEVRTAMHQQAVAFFEHIVREDRPVSEILSADYGFLDSRLARFYGSHAPAEDVPMQKVALENTHRGGLLGLGAVLTVTSAPRRTSPVKRGDWILRRVLGTPVPPPPADAGSIAADEVNAEGLTIRQQLAVHRRQASCNNCHARIDPLGFALEHFDAVGRWRDRYQNGAPIDASGETRDGTTISGADGLRDYLAKQQDQFRRNLCTKLVGYALGRRESIADVQLIDNMSAALAEDERLSSAIETLVVSRQFRYRRGAATSPTNEDGAGHDD